MGCKVSSTWSVSKPTLEVDGDLFQELVKHILSDLSQHSRPGKGPLGLLKEDPKESPLLTEGSVPLLRAESAS